MIAIAFVRLMYEQDCDYMKCDDSLRLESGGSVMITALSSGNEPASVKIDSSNGCGVSRQHKTRGFLYTVVAWEPWTGRSIEVATEKLTGSRRD